jgi:hypothetical protein
MFVDVSSSIGTVRLESVLRMLHPSDHPWYLLVVKFHLASFAHYDFRLEYSRLNDIKRPLASWATNEGPSLDPNEWRVATRVGDHGMSGFSFEEKLRGRFTIRRDQGDKWSLVKERDHRAEPGSDITSEKP